MTLEELRTQALRYLATGDFARALALEEWVVRAFPTALDDRMRVADVLVQCALPEQAKRVYAAVAYLDMQGGRPLHALVAIQALADLGEAVAPLRMALASLYAAGSSRVARVGARLALPLGDTVVTPGGVAEPRSLAEAAATAGEAAAELRSVGALPAEFPPVPLLSDLSEAALGRVLATAVVRRLGHGAVVVREGDPAEEFYFVAAGTVRVVMRSEAGEPSERARLHEGALFGEMALVAQRPRAATVEVVGAADLVMLGREAFRAAAGELGAIAVALERHTRERLVKNLVATSPLFRPFDEEQRRDLSRYFALRDVAPGEELVREGAPGDGLCLLLSGEVEVLKAEAGGEVRVGWLGPGGCFGMISLLRRQPATATVRALGPGTLLVLAPKYFDRLVGAVPELSRYFDELSDAQLRATEAALEAARAGEGPLI